MKFLQKATLAAAIAVAPFAAQAELKAMDDALMSATTGQAGVTIDLNFKTGVGDDAAIEVGKVTYADEGQVQINNIQVGSANANFKITQKVDVLADGKLQMTVDPVTGLNVQVESVHLAAQTADGSVNSATVGDALASEINLTLDLGTTTTTIGANSLFTRPDPNNAGSTLAGAIADNAGEGVDGDTIVIDASAELKLTAGSMNALGGGVKISGLKFDNDGNNAVVKQKIYASNTGVNIVLEEITGDLQVGSLILGASSTASIGSLTVSDIKMAGVTQTIYGH